MKQRLLVIAKEWNQSRNVLFMMKEDSHHLHRDHKYNRNLSDITFKRLYSDNYTVLGKGEFYAKRRGMARGITLKPRHIGVFLVNDKAYGVYADWSLREIEWEETQPKKRRLVVAAQRSSAVAARMRGKTSATDSR